jgi:hypothetical protein
MEPPSLSPAVTAASRPALVARWPSTLEVALPVAHSISHPVLVQLVLAEISQ